MELFNLNRKFLRQDTIDVFRSAIWTERYYGDSEVEIFVDPTPDMYRILAKGMLVGLVGSDEIMMIETLEAEDGNLKASGISLTKWLNNRFIRTSALHEDRYWTIENKVPGQIMSEIVQQMCIDGPYLDGTIPTGIASPTQLKIPGLVLGDYYKAGGTITIGVPFGPVFDALYEIATTHEIGQQIILVSASESGYSLHYRNYKGLDRTSQQMINSQVRFSPAMDSLTDVKELQSIANFKTQAWAFAPANPDNLASQPGHDGLYSVFGGIGGVFGDTFRGFDLRALMVFAEDITTDQVGGNADVLWEILNNRAHDALMNSQAINVVDGSIVPDMQFQYGQHYNLGDLVEIQGVSGTIREARVLEYIRVKDANGERAYPTLSSE